MRRLRIRLSLRSLMLLIALTALAIGVEVGRRRRAYHSAKAAEFRRLEEGLMWLASREDAKAAEEIRKAEEYEEEARSAGQRALRHGAMSAAWVNFQKNELDLAALRRQNAALHIQEAESDRRSSAEYGRLGRLHENAAAHPWLWTERHDGL